MGPVAYEAALNTRKAPHCMWKIRFNSGWTPKMCMDRGYLVDGVSLRSGGTSIYIIMKVLGSRIYLY